MKLTRTVIALAVTTSPAIGQSLPDSLPYGVTPEMVEAGRQVFERDGFCTSCHGVGGQGAVGPDLTDSGWWHVRGSYLEIVRQVMDGTPQAASITGNVMPPRGGSYINDDDVLSVAAYVWKLSHPEDGDSIPLGVTGAMVERGSVVFHGPGRCATCHGSDATGNIGPDLTDPEWLHAKGSYLAIVQRIIVGVPDGQSRNGVGMPPRGGANLSDEQVYAVAAYVWALSRLR